MTPRRIRRLRAQRSAMELAQGFAVGVLLVAIGWFAWVMTP